MLSRGPYIFVRFVSFKPWGTFLHVFGVRGSELWIVVGAYYVASLDRRGTCRRVIFWTLLGLVSGREQVSVRGIARPTVLLAGARGVSQGRARGDSVRPV